MILSLDVQNEKVAKILHNAAMMDLKGDNKIKSRGLDPNEYDIISQYAVSRSYLNKRLESDFPNIEYATNLIIGEAPGGKFLLDNLKTLLDYDRYYTSGYDPKGFVGWHSDTDIFGYYIMLTYNESGDGFFRYLSGTNIITLQDNRGWMVRMMTLGDRKENAVWHCALSNSPRFTFLLHFDDEVKYKKAIKLIQGEA